MYHSYSFLDCPVQDNKSGRNVDIHVNCVFRFMEMHKIFTSINFFHVVTTNRIINIISIFIYDQTISSYDLHVPSECLHGNKDTKHYVKIQQYKILLVLFVRSIINEG